MLQHEFQTWYRNRDHGQSKATPASLFVAFLRNCQLHEHADALIREGFDTMQRLHWHRVTEEDLDAIRVHVSHWVKICLWPLALALARSGTPNFKFFTTSRSGDGQVASALKTTYMMAILRM
jgi:hypothetical protein